MQWRLPSWQGHLELELLCVSPRIKAGLRLYFALYIHELFVLRESSPSLQRDHSVTSLEAQRLSGLQSQF